MLSPVDTVRFMLTEGEPQISRCGSLESSKKLSRQGGSMERLLYQIRYKNSKEKGFQYTMREGK